MNVSLKLMVAVMFSLCSVAAAADAPDVSWQLGNPPLSPFGIGDDYHTGQNLLAWLPQIDKLGIPMLRTCSAEQMDYVAANHMDFGKLLFKTPDDDKLDAPGSLPVKDIHAWTAYVADCVKKANGRVKYFEVWNEPPNFTGKHQTPEDYCKIVVSAYDTIHQLAPTALVGLAAKSVHVNYLEQVIKSGAKDHFDYIVLHPYESLGIAVDHPGAEPVYANIVRTVRRMLAAQDPARMNVPILFTELGSDARRGADHQASALIKAYTMGIAQGVACIEWFEGIDGDSGPMGLMDARGIPRPAYSAMGQMIAHLGLHPQYLGWVLLHEKNYGFVFQGAKGTVLISWAELGTTDSVQLSKASQIVDALTGKQITATDCALTNMPVFVLDIPDDLLDQARLNKDKPLTWDGDYSNAKSVSVTFGQKNVEKGLHTQSGQSIAEDVIAYGGAARSGGIPGGNIFMVDPNFLLYTPTPIEISIRVRRNSANDNAGFKLVYESTAGYRNLAWYTVPNDKDWHTVTYKIVDDEFVSMWGYNFLLNSDGNKFNKYEIQSVTVTKDVP